MDLHVFPILIPTPTSLWKVSIGGQVGKDLETGGSDLCQC